MIMVVHEVGPTTTLVAVQPSSGQILYDEFADDASKRMLEQRLEVIEPLEIILPKSIALRTKDAIKFYRDSSSDGCITVEETDDAMFATGAAKLQDVVDGLEGSRGLVQLLPNLSDSVSAGLYVLLEFLKQFGMEAAIVASENLEQVATAAEQEDTAPMKLPAITIRNLEIFQTVASNDCGRGTLFHAINRTKTRPGARMLKDWISQPLTSTAKILSRQEVVGHLIRPDNGLSVTFRKTLSMVMDLEVALMATLYKKVRPTDFVRLCEAMVKLHRMAETSLVEDNGGKLPPLLDKILKDVESNFAKSLELARRIDPAAAKEEKWDRIFWDWGFSPVVAEKREEIAELVESLEEHKKDIMKAMGLFSFQYTTVSGLEYLVEVKQNASRSVPSEWTKMNSTKQVSRYRTAFICLTLPKLQYSRECLAAECKKAWREFLDAEFLSDGFSGFQLGAKRVAELDCLVSLADLAREEGFCAPVFNTEGRVTVRKGRNLVVEKSLSIHEQFVPNDIVLDSQAGSRALVLTGPNMGGKSCYLRQLGTIAIMAQIGGYVPAEEASMPIFDALFVRYVRVPSVFGTCLEIFYIFRIGARDDMWARKSTLMVELEDASLILRDATENSLVLIDELGRGTSTNDGSAIAKAVLENLVNEIRCLTVFVTHYRSVSDMENQFKGLQKYNNCSL
jgi:DNA mismatch repair protein MSH3